MAKCSFCEREIAHPGGDDAINRGWTVAEISMGRGENKEDVVVIGCPEHHDKVADEMRSWMGRWKSRREKRRMI
jgi:hypothetical protein